MLTRFNKLTRKKKTILIVLLLLAIPVSYRCMIGTQNHRKWSAIETELKGLGMKGHIIYGPSSSSLFRNSYIINILEKWSPVLRKSVQGKGGVFSVDGPLSDDFMKRLPGSEEFFCIHLDNTAITDEVIPHLLKYPNLTKLTLINCGISGSQFQELTKLKKLNSLRFYKTQVDDSAVKNLVQVPDLTYLDLQSTLITNQSLAYLSECKKLTELNLSDTKITDDGIRKLSSNNSIQYLFLLNTSITDDCIPHLIKMKSLRYLDLKGTTITMQGIRKMEKQIPVCSINR